MTIPGHKTTNKEVRFPHDLSFRPPLSISVDLPAMPPWTPQWDGEDLPPLPVFAMAERLKIMPSAQSDVEWHEVFLNEKLDELSSRRKTKIVDALTALWRLQSVKADAGDSPEWGIYVAVWVVSDVALSLVFV